MPRIKDDESQEAGATPERVTRARRPVPEGVETGLTMPKPVEPPVKGGTGRRGRAVSSTTLQTIDTLKRNPGQWFEIGVFMSATPPSKASALGQHGFKFAHVRNENGTFTRSAMYPGDEPTAA